MAAIRGILTDFEKELYHRNIQIPEVGEAGQLKLLGSRVLIVGLGGLGSPAVFYLAACGIGEIGIADGDRVELSNLQRQILHGREDVGSDKTASAARSVARLRPDLRLRTYPCRITEANASEIIAPYDFVIEATDRPTLASVLMRAMASVEDMTEGLQLLPTQERARHSWRSASN